MSENENMKRKLFNAQCVKIMGWKRGDYSADIMYFDGVSGERIMAVEDYNPCDDLVQMMPVVDVLCGALGLHLNSGTIQREGLLEAARELILDTILSDADAEDESEEFDELYQDLKDISDSFQIETNLPHASGNREVIKGCVGKERFWETDFLFNLTDAQLYPDALDVEEGWDEYDKYPDVKQEQKDFNLLCGHIMHIHAQAQGGSVLLKDFDPYYNANETINVLEIVLQYLPSSIKFPIHGRAAYDDPTERNILKDMQKFITLYGTDEYMLPPAVAFNKMCATIVDGFNVVDCQPIDENFDPYNNIEDLAPIIPIIATRVSEYFTLGNIMYDVCREDSYNMDVFDNMRHYTERHGPAMIKILEDGE